MSGNRERVECGNTYSHKIGRPVLRAAMPSPGLSVIDKNQSCYLVSALLFSVYALGMTFGLLIPYKYQAHTCTQVLEEWCLGKWSLLLPVWSSAEALLFLYPKALVCAAFVSAWLKKPNKGTKDLQEPVQVKVRSSRLKIGVNCIKTHTWRWGAIVF